MINATGDITFDCHLLSASLLCICGHVQVDAVLLLVDQGFSNRTEQRKRARLFWLGKFPFSFVWIFKNLLSLTTTPRGTGRYFKSRKIGIDARDHN